MQILRQGENPIKIYDSRWFLASAYNVELSIMAGQRSHVTQRPKTSCVMDFHIDPWSPGGYPGGSRTDTH